METLSGQIGGVIWICLAGLIMWRGGRPERLAAGALLAAWLATLALSTDTEAFVRANPGWGILAVDSWQLAVLVWIALWADRRWLTTAAGFQAIAVMVHFVGLVDPRIMAISYAVAQNIATFCVMICVTVSALRQGRAD